MNIQNLLLPFIENTDYAIQNGELVALLKVRAVQQIISHPEIAAVAGQAATPEVPATFDEEGNELTPLIPAQEEIVAVDFQAAYDEVVSVDETYYENIPTMDALKLSQITDIVTAIEEYLADKSELRDPENDSINIVDNRIFSWGFANIQQPSIIQLYDAHNAAVIKKAEVNRKRTLAELGAKSRLACQNCLDLIAGFNLQRNLTAEQITAMQSSFGNIQTALMTSRPTSAKFLIAALVPDEVIVTSVMKETILSALEEF